MRCAFCNGYMIKVKFYDPDGEMPLDIIYDENGEGWVCLKCDKVGNSRCHCLGNMIL